MPFNSIVVKNIVHELKSVIHDGKIDKIHQPENDEIIMSIRTDTKSHKLLLSSNANYPRVHLTDISKENPQVAPNFCMLLRKYLQNGRIINIIQPDFERIIEFHISSTDEFGDKTIKRLIIEMMGKYSNIILVDENSRVLDSIKHVSHEISRVREVLPGSLYFAPPTSKLNPLSLNYNDFKNIFESASVDSIGEVTAGKFNGFGNVIANEIEYRYSILGHSYNPIDINLLWEEFSKFIEKIENFDFKPVLYKDESTNQPYDFCSIELHHIINYKAIYFDSISKLIENFYGQKDFQLRLKHKTESLLKNVQLLLDRNERQYSKLNETIIQSENKEKYKIWGDLILANIYSIKADDKILEAINYYSENQELIKINLDTQLSPAENAQRYYRKYNKLKSAENTAKELIENVKIEIDYLESVIVNLENCNSEEDISLIRLELSEQGYIKKQKGAKKQSNIKSKPNKFISSDGFTIFVGKNNVQNDELTLKTANNNDLWFHTKEIHGSHVIIRTENKSVPDSTLLEAATLAAYFSKAKMSSNVSVDYTTVKNVKKPSGAKPGMVNYFNYSTIVVTPIESVVEKLRAASN